MKTKGLEVIAGFVLMLAVTSVLAASLHLPSPNIPTQGLRQDAQLMKLYKMALENNPSLAVFSAKQQAAEHQQQQAESYEKAQVQLKSELSYAWMKKKDFARTANQLKASYPLYQPDKADQSQAADYQRSAADQNLSAERQTLWLQLAQLYYRYWSQKAQVDFLIKEQRSITSIMSQVRQRFQVGYQNLNDIAEVQARLDSNQADLLAAKQQLAVTESTFSEWIGSPISLAQMKMPDNLPKDSWFVPVQKTTDLPMIPSDWLRQNPKLLALSQSEQAANSEVDYEKRKNGVQLAAFGAYVYNDSGGNYYDDMQGVKGGLELSYPLYLGGRTDAAVAKSRAKVAEIQAQQRQLLLKLQATARNSLLSYQAGIARLKALKSALASNKEAVKATENGLTTGTRNILDLLNAQRRLHKAQRDIPMTRAQIWQSWFQFYGALGLLKTVS